MVRFPSLIFLCCTDRYSYSCQHSAGYYVPYIANYLYEHPGLVPLHLKGIWITDPSLSWDLVQEYIPALPLVHKFEHVWAFNQSFLNELQKRSDACGFTDYSAKYATYPPKGPLPLLPNTFKGTPTYGNMIPECTLWDDIFTAALTVNPNFNLYRILDVWPVLWVCTESW
jgi:carboxypeptidase D